MVINPLAQIHFSVLVVVIEILRLKVTTISVLLLISRMLFAREITTTQRCHHSEAAL